jgi:hypothetical protein
MGLRSPSLRLAGLRLSESVTVVYDSQRGDGFLLAVKCFRNGDWWYCKQTTTPSIAFCEASENNCGARE